MTGGADRPEITLLVVEDDLGLAELVREELELRQWRCVHCATGQEALAWLAGHEPTLALLDYSLPDMTGAELLERRPIRRFIVTTGAGDERVAVAMMKRGALDYLVKDGLFLDTLGEVVELALRHIGTEERLAQAERSLSQAQQELVRARRMESLGLMAGGVAHDFNNLLQGIQGNLEIARLKAGEPAQAPLDRALKVLDKASRLSHRMLEFSGKGLRDSEPLALEALVRHSLQSLMDLTGDRVRFQAQPGLPEIEGDRQQLAQVLTALVLNARESLGSGPGSIEVRAGLHRAGPGPDPGAWIQPPPPGLETVCLSVADGGSGMTAEVLERAFEPFFSTRSAGRGLGLSAALGIVRNHDAGLWVASAPGQGTTFRVHFAPYAAAGPARAPQPARAPGAARRTVLLVDDDEDLQESLAEYLGEVLGYPILQARDGQEAVEVYRREREVIGLILMDATMPRLTGPAAFQAIRELAPEAKAILCSGFSDEAGSRAARDAGFLGYLKKPFLLRTLETMLRQVLGA